MAASRCVFLPIWMQILVGGGGHDGISGPGKNETKLVFLGAGWEQEG